MENDAGWMHENPLLRFYSFISSLDCCSQNLKLFICLWFSIFDKCVYILYIIVCLFIYMLCALLKQI